MKRSTARFLQVVVVLVGIGALALMLWEPHLEGRNARATVFQIYFNDPFLAYAYAASLAFFAALYQAFKVLAYAARNKLISWEAVTALRLIKYCGISLVVFVAAPVAWLLIARPGDDIAGGVAVGLFLILAFTAIAAAAAVFEKTFRSALEIKSGNGLPV